MGLSMSDGMQDITDVMESVTLQQAVTHEGHVLLQPSQAGL
jgi:hypothetical protein